MGAVAATTLDGVSEADPARVRLPHIDGLDGIRGLAVLAVLLFHGGVTWAAGGFLGVDAFFVLSGFLIATLALFEMRRSGSLGLRAFWARRVRRLLPALLLLLVGVAAYAVLVAPVDTIRSIRADALATLTYVANWRFLVAGRGYFAQAGPPSPLLHTWSLAIEEQFYVVFPLVMVFVVRRSRRPEVAVGIGAGVLAVASAVEMAVLSHDTNRVYYGTDTRAQSLLVGVALAGLFVHSVARRRHARRGRWMDVVAPFALALAVALAARLDGSSTFLYRGGLFLFSLAIGVVVLDLARRPASRLGRALAWRPLVLLGAISYGVYVFHWPLFLVLNHERTGLSGAALLAVRLLVTLAVAALSYRLLERPVVRGALRARRFPAFVPAAAAGSVAALVAATVVVIPPPSFTEAAEAGTARAAATTTTTPVVPAANARVVPADRHVRVMVIGDSVAMTLADGMAPVSAKYDVDILDRARIGCGLARGGPLRYFGEEQPEPWGCDAWPQTWGDAVAKDDPDVVVVLAGRWEVVDRQHDGQWMNVGDAAFDAYLTSELATVTQIVSSRGAVVVFATAPYFKRGEKPNGSLYPEDEPWRVDQWNALLRAFVSSHPSTALVDLGALLSPQGKLAYTIDGIRVREGDGVHITPQGARWLAPQVLPGLTQLVERTPAPGTAASPPPSSIPPR